MTTPEKQSAQRRGASLLDWIEEAASDFIEVKAHYYGEELAVIADAWMVVKSLFPAYGSRDFNLNPSEQAQYKRIDHMLNIGQMLVLAKS